MSERYAIYPPCRIGHKLWAVLDMELPFEICTWEVAGVALLHGKWYVAGEDGEWFEYGSWAALPTLEEAEKLKEELEAENL